MAVKKILDEQVIQKFSCRCPYCEQPVSYEDLHLQPGENEIICPSCNRTYVKVVAPSLIESGHKHRVNRRMTGDRSRNAK